VITSSETSEHVADFVSHRNHIRKTSFTNPTFQHSSASGESERNDVRMLPLTLAVEPDLLVHQGRVTVFALH
jgi:hypothetical protein